MSWEPVEEWPDGRAGGVFRGAAEVVLARRGAPTLGDRVRLWWHSTPDHPFAAIPLRVALTPSWLYVETRGGRRQRARVEQIRGSRREAGRVIYAVSEGNDLVLADRGGDALERQLDDRLGTASGWRSPNPWLVVAIVATLMLAISLAVTWSYHDEALERIAVGLTTSESALGLYGGLGGVLLTLLFITFFPQRYVVDSLGITSVRGLFGWVRSTIPVERVGSVYVGRHVSRAKNGHWVTHWVDVACGERSTKRLFGGKPVKPREAEPARQAALGIGRRVARIFDVELHDRSEP